MKKYWLIAIALIGTQAAFSQDTYLEVKIFPQEDCGTCQNISYYVLTDMEDNVIDDITHSPSHSTLNYTYVLANYGDQYKIKYWCDEYNGTDRFFEVGTFEVVENTNNSYTSYAFRAGTCHYSLNVALKYYEIPGIKNIRRVTDNSIGSLYCSKNPDELLFKIEFDIPVHVFPDYSFDIWVYDDKGKYIWHTSPIDNWAVFSYNDIAPVGNYYGKELKLQAVIDLSTHGAYNSSNDSRTRYFANFRYVTIYDVFGQMPVKVVRRGCDPPIRLEVELDENMRNFYEELTYNVRIRDLGIDTSNYVQMDIVSFDGTTLELDPDPLDMVLFSNGIYTDYILSYEINLNESETENYMCAGESEFTDNQPVVAQNVLNISYKEYSYTDDNNQTASYHVTMPGGNDGRIIFTGNNINRIDKLVHISKTGVQTVIPSSRITKTGNKLYVNNVYKGEFNSIRVDYIDGCQKQFLIQSLNEPQLLTINQTTISSPVCNTQNEYVGDLNINETGGKIEFSWSGGIGPYKIRIENPDNGKIITIDNLKTNSYATAAELSAGNYKIILSDNYSMQKIEYQSIAEPAYFSFNTSATDISCNGKADGKIYLIPNAAYKNQLKGYYRNNVFVATQPNFTLVNNLSSGEYKLSLVNLNDCKTGDKYVEILEPDKFIGTIQIQPVDEPGNATGKLWINFTGGTSPYYFELYREQTEIESYLATGNVTVNNLKQGDYTLYMSDYKGCAYPEIQLEIKEPDEKLKLEMDTIIHVSCKGGNSGFVQLKASGGWDGHYRYGKNGSITGDSPVFHNLQKGYYTFFVIDSMDVKASYNIEITEPPLLEVTADHTDSLTCYGNSSGKAYFNITGGTQPYTIVSNYGEFVGDSMYGLPAVENEQVIIRDKNGCTQSTFITIGQPEELNVSVDFVSDAKCYGDHTGSVSLSVTGGNMGFAVSENAIDWIDGVFLDQLGRGDYSVYIKDKHGCMDSILVTINEPEKLVSMPVVKELKCFNDQSGQIIPNISGGTSPYEISTDSNNWSLADTLKNLSAQSNYIYYFRDSNGCNDQNIVTITQPEQLTAIIDTIRNVSCYGRNDGFVNLTISGGKSPYFHKTELTNNWIPGGYINNLKATEQLNIEIRDQNFCHHSIVTTIAEPEKLEAQIDKVYRLTCYENKSGSVKLNISGGTEPYFSTITGELSIEGDSLYGLTAGDKVIYLKDHNLCSSEVNAVIQQPEPIVVKDSIKNAFCNNENGAIWLMVDGGTVSENYIFSWYKNGTILANQNNHAIENIGAGLYSISIIDDNECNHNENFTVANLDGPEIVSYRMDTIRCFGDSTGIIEVDEYSAGAGNCNFYLIKQDETGLEDSIYSQKPDAGFFERLSAGQYYIVVSDSAGCVDIQHIEMIEEQKINHDVEIETPLCFGNQNGSISISSHGGQSPYQYVWSNGMISDKLDNLAAGTYFVSTTDQNSCTVYDSVVLTEPVKMELKYDIYTPLCHDSDDGIVALQSIGGTAPYLYTWSDGSDLKDRFGVSAGEYGLTVTDINGCLRDTTVSVASPGKIAISLEIEEPSCFGMNNGKISAYCNGGTGILNYMWSNGQTSKNISGIAAGEYKIVVTDELGCKNEQILTLLQPGRIYISDSLVFPACNGFTTGQIFLSIEGGTGGYKVSWNDGDSSMYRTSLYAGLYRVTVSDENGCIVQDHYQISEPDALVLNEKIIHESCYNAGDGAIEIEAHGGTLPYTYSWTDDLSGNKVNGLSGGTFVITVTDRLNCEIIREYTIESPEAPLPGWTENEITLCSGNELLLSAGEFPSIVWYRNNSFIFEGSSYPITEPGQYRVEITDAYGCRGADTMIIHFSDHPLDAMLLIPDSAAIAEEITVLDVTWPVPDSIEWQFDHDVVLIDSSLWSMVFSCNDEGFVDVTLRAWLGGCYSDSTKSVYIIGEQVIDLSKSVSEDALEINCSIFPNPVKDRFYAEIELSRRENIRILLYDGIRGGIIAEKKLEDNSYYHVSFENILPGRGVYLLVLEVKDAYRVIKIVAN